jgi:hypothetical protein
MWGDFGGDTRAFLRFQQQDLETTLDPHVVNKR